MGDRVVKVRKTKACTCTIFRWICGVSASIAKKNSVAGEIVHQPENPRLVAASALFQQIIDNKLEA